MHPSIFFEIEIFRKFSISKFFRGMHLWMDADHRLINIFPSDQKHSTMNYMKLTDAIFFVLNVDSRREILNLHIYIYIGTFFFKVYKTAVF